MRKTNIVIDRRKAARSLREYNKLYQLAKNIVFLSTLRMLAMVLLLAESVELPAGNSSNKRSFPYLIDDESS